MASINNIKLKINPFPGLRSFSPDESRFFFGRKIESELLLSKLVHNRFVAVIGASGSGKSSLIKSGLLPEINKLSLSGSPLWNIFYMTPGKDPFESMAEEFIRKSKIEDSDNSRREEIIALLKINSDGIINTFDNLQYSRKENVLIIIDQLEEIFRYRMPGKAAGSGSDQSLFLNLLTNTLSREDLNIYFVIAIRPDFISECSQYKDFIHIINSSNFLISQMSKQSFREVIESPLIVSGEKIEEELVETLLNDISANDDQLIVLQHAMMRIWARWKELDEPERPLGYSDYQSIGSMNDAISRHADEVYNSLSSRSREICEKLFKIITSTDNGKKCISRPAKVKAVKNEILCSTVELSEVVEKFTDRSVSVLSVKGSNPLNDDSIIELSHENIIRLWGRLRKWVEDETASGEMYRFLSDASSMYQQGRTGLLKDPDLQLAVKWRDKNKPNLQWAQRYNPAYERAMVYLRTSEKKHLENEERKILHTRWKMRRVKMISLIFGVVAVLTALFMVASFASKLNTNKQLKEVKKQYQEIATQKNAAEEYASYTFKKTIEADSALANVTHMEQEERIKHEIAEKNALEARKQNDIIRKQFDSVLSNKISTDKALKAALDQKAETQRKRMISIAKSMSLRSIQMGGQKDIQTLLAYQAYLFNRNNRGLRNDADIFEGLYKASLTNGTSVNRSFEGHTGGIKSIAFVPGRNEFFTSGNDGKVLKWSLDKKEKAIQIIYSGSEIIEVLAVSPDASWLAMGSESSAIKMVPLNPENAAYEMAGNKGKIKSLIFSYDGKNLYSASSDGFVLKWDLATRTNTNVSPGTMQITSIDITPGGDHIAGISSEGAVVVWDPKNSSDNFRIETKGNDIKVVRFNPANDLLAVGYVNGSVELWDIEKRKRISEVKAYSAQINDIKFNTSLGQMAVAGNDRTLKLYNTSDPGDLSEPPVSFGDNEGFIVVIQFSPDGDLIISGSFENNLNLLGRPTNADLLARNVCNSLTRNMTRNEWNSYVAIDIPFEKTCEGKDYHIKVDPIK